MTDIEHRRLRLAEDPTLRRCTRPGPSILHRALPPAITFLKSSAYLYRFRIDHFALVD